MGTHRVYVYVDGADLDEVESELLSSFGRFAAGWNHGAVRVVNDRSERTPDLHPDDLPTWNLGLNLNFNKLPRRGVEQLVSFLVALSESTGREFVIGDWDSEHQISEDWCFVGPVPKPSDVEFLVERYGEL